MDGKKKCRALREIRSRIAQENEIDLPTRECAHTGECSGTCPYCEAEVQVLERQLKRRASLGKRIVVAGICAGLVAATAGCALVDDSRQTTGILPATAEPSPTEAVLLAGEIAPETLP